MTGLKIRREISVDGTYVSAWAPFPQVPHYHSDTTQNGTVEYLFTPPVSQGRDAIRIRATRHLDASGVITSSKWEQERCESWNGYASRTNWAGTIYGDHPSAMHRFRWETEKTLPKSLYRRWMPDVLQFIHAQDPKELADRLSSHEDWLRHQNQNAQKSVRAGKTNEDRYGRVEHGDIFLVDRPINFQDGTVRQAFLALRKNAKGAKIKSYIIPENFGGDRPIYPFVANFGRITRAKMFKLCQAAIDDHGSELTAHETIELFGLQQKIRANLDRIKAF
jgi:hypothetical protein